MGSNQNRETPQSPNLWKLELILLLVLLGTGLLLLPVLIYFTAAPVAGEYPGDGLWGLTKHIWADLGRGRGIAWLLVLCPYLFVQLLRLAVTSWRGFKDVTQVTKPE
jgi:hypothetical protein